MTFSGTSRRRALKLGLAASLAAPAIVRAQAWPSGPIVFLNPFPAGGSITQSAMPAGGSTLAMGSASPRDPSEPTDPVPTDVPPSDSRRMRAACAAKSVPVRIRIESPGGTSAWTVCRLRRKSVE